MPAKAKRPAPASERETAAWEYHAASESLREAETRRGKAKALCILLGVMPDYESEPYAEGTVQTVYDGKQVRIVMTVVASIERLDQAGFIKDVAKLGIDERRLTRLVRKHSVRLRPAHIFKTSVVA